MKTRPISPKRGAHALLCACALMAAVPPHAQNLPTLGDTERQDLSPVMERKLGEEIMTDIRRNIDYLDDAPVLEYLNEFGAQLVAARPDARGEAGYDFFFFAVRDPAINAFALPGGFIGVHSQLLLTAQNESELASVLSHEVGHVAQRHIARSIGKQKQDMLIPLAAAILAAVAARSNGDAAAALMMGGEGLAIQRQLSFSREAEREADRIGFQILQAAGFDTAGMVNFFGRMQHATRGYSDAVPAYLRSHPLTTERMADIDARNRERGVPGRRTDSIDFHLIRARMRVLQDPSATGLREAENVFRAQMEQKDWRQIAGAQYGLAFLAFRQGRLQEAESRLLEARVACARALAAMPKQAAPAPEQPLKVAVNPVASQGAVMAAKAGVTAASILPAVPAGVSGTAAKPVFSGTPAPPPFDRSAPAPAPAQHAIFTALSLDIALARAQSGGAAERQAAVRLADEARAQYPVSRGIALQYADALDAAGQYDQAAAYLRDQIQSYRTEPQLHDRLAKVYAESGKRALQHIELAESYALSGSTQAALEQLNFARKAGDATYYDHSVIDARERELQARRKDELKDKKS